MRIVLGIDPGLTHTGYGLIGAEGNKFQHISHGTIRTDASLTHPERLLQLYQSLSRIVDEYKPIEAGVERIYFAKNAKTALPVSQGRGVILLCLVQRAVRCFDYTPSEIKQAVIGRGRADKAQIQRMIKVIFRLDSVPESDHASDALAVAFCHINRSKASRLMERGYVQ
jgi:crossover junction endodeoxyribonuclease RuvC